MKWVFVVCTTAVLCTIANAGVMKRQQDPIEDASFQYVFAPTCTHVTIFAIDKKVAYVGGTLVVAASVAGVDGSTTTTAAESIILPNRHAFIATIGPFDPCSTIQTSLTIVDGNGEKEKIVNGSFETDCPCDDGSVHGDPHYNSYDGRKINYQGPCGYILSKDGCLGKGTSTFEICAINSGAEDEDLRTRHLSGLRLTTDSGNILDISKHHTILNGDTIPRHTSAASEDLVLLMFMQGHKFIVYHTGRQFWIEVTEGRLDVYIHQDSELRGNVCGMFGDADGDVSNDMVSPAGITMADDKTLGEVWECPNSCEIKNLLDEIERM